MKLWGSRARMESKALHSRMEREVCRLERGTEGLGRRLLELRRACLALRRREASGRVLEVRELLRWLRMEVREGEEEVVAEGIVG
jgi:hypothetical protein